MLCKVQIPIASNDPTPLALIYNRDRSFMTHVPICDELKKRMRGSLKEFFHAKKKPDGSVELLERATWQNW